MDNIKTWTGLSVKESIRMTEDRDKWRKYFHGVVNPRIEAELLTTGTHYPQIFFYCNTLNTFKKHLSPELKLRAVQLYS